ncbi:N-acyl-D-glucosamine 2-epimerase [Paenibacillus spongiae]|uniref:N-acyl-D-glucosamine 2-epimerase n=1 Tax=Paenibacillus spongiae TaxID=2909671 RepID=A0ABY5S9W2_9BACL|nr:N-acyl-D-glucosamine 2-epimerase [Paenibacillus spongiae]UVI29508.1 N-acyl-D-glucosamine 2-epimerase [Paenibacillus spongiae]
MLKGPSIQIDPLFPYYRNRSADSIAEEIELAGYRSVHYFVVNENVVDKALIDAFHGRGIGVWAMVIGNGTFSTADYPDEWPSWQMGLLKETNDGFQRFSHFSPGYARWKKAAMVKLASGYPFDGIEIAEPYFPEWGGIERGVYGDVGPLAQSAFLKQYGLEMPEFTDSESPRYYLTDTETYMKWAEFRVDAVNGFIDEMINAKDGVRAARPDILVATWSLAIDAGPDSMEALRVEQGMDAPSMIARVRPDMHMLQTHWPDWIKGDLPPDYTRKYIPFMDAIRTAFPELPLGVQADIGSGETMIKGGQWLEQFEAAAYDIGFTSWTAYEYHIGGYMYESAPVPLRARRNGPDELILSFNKRIDEHSASDGAHYAIIADEQRESGGWTSVAVDGNRVALRAEKLPAEPFELEIGTGITDTPDKWLFKNRPANAVPAGTRIRIAGAGAEDADTRARL